ncbi:MAG: transglycosylase SLT domain-containing protein, partial [Gemmatimonadetes bacterium]|nr:transglycosylase SLT domain-containing protein [Gemmatimonadota bacterium]
ARDETQAGARLLDALAGELPQIADYLKLWSLEALATVPSGLTGTAPRRLDSPADGDPVQAERISGAPAVTVGRGAAETLYADLLALGPSPALLRAADRARADLYMQSRDPARARPILAGLVGRSSRRDRPALLMQLALLDERLGQPERGRDGLRRIVEHHPESTEALALLEGSQGSGMRLALSARDGARVLAAHGRVEEAVAALTPTSDPRLLELRADILLRSDRYAEAAVAYAEAAAAYAEAAAAHPEAAPADGEAVTRGGDRDRLAFEEAKAWTRAGEPGRAREIYRRLARENESASGGTLAYLLADAFQDESRDPAFGDSAAGWFRRFADSARGSSLGRRGLLRLAHLRFGRGEWAVSEELFREYLRLYPGGEDVREARYWRARALQQAGRPDEARSIFASLLQGSEGYYSLLARRRLGGSPDAAVAALFGQAGEGPGALSSPAPTDVQRGSPVPDVLPDSPAARPLARARALLILGEVGWARREMDEAVRLAGRSRAELQRVAAWALEGLYPESAFRVGAALLPGSAENRDLATLAYPRAFAPLVLSEAGEAGVPPSLLWAIMRQESSFDPAVRSPAGALGLLQLMPATARSEAARGRVTSFELSDLERPEANLHLGAAHLRDLADSLGGSWVAAIAAYNAGQAVTRVWLGFPEAANPETFVERIPFRETRHYVKQVVSNRARYQDLYGLP